MDIEAIWYEYSPYIYLVVGAIVIFNVESRLGMASGSVLVATAAVIMRLRWRYRQNRG